MGSTKAPTRIHRHRSVIQRVIEQRGGVPYELERKVCATCGHELSRRRLRRATAA